MILQTKQKSKKFLITVVFFLAVSMLVGVLKAKAGITENIVGWIWGGSNDGAGNFTGVGWISMNSLNCDTDNNGLNDACDMNGDSIINAADFVPVSNYGVNIPAAGDLSGYAWSENMGAIAFTNADGYLNGCPAGNGACSARRVGNNLEGWARFVEIAKAEAVGNSGGWAGWIKLNGTANGTDYGVKINGKELEGYAWSGGYTSGDELGAISFKGTNYGAEFLDPVVTLTPSSTTIDLESKILPYTFTLHWTTKYATECTKSGDFSGDLTPAEISTGSGDISVTQSAGSGTYKLTCKNAVNGQASATATAITSCNLQKCSATQTCDSNYEATGDPNIAACHARSTCSSYSDCAPKTTGSWREVMP